MRVLLSIFLFFTMITSTVVSVVQHIQDSVICENRENKDDDNTKSENEKERKSETEKELTKAKNLYALTAENLAAFNAKLKYHLKDETCISSLYVFLPENPPVL